MPLNLAVFGTGKADAVIKAYPDIKHWAIGGHSLGGAMAAGFAHNHPDAIDGLVFWAAYPASNNSLAGSNLKVTSISGIARRAGYPREDRCLPATAPYRHPLGGYRGRRPRPVRLVWPAIRG